MPLIVEKETTVNLKGETVETLVNVCRIADEHINQYTNSRKPIEFTNTKGKYQFTVTEMDNIRDFITTVNENVA